MGLPERPEQKRRVEVLRVNVLEVVKKSAHVIHFVDVVCSRAVFVDFLQEQKIGIVASDRGGHVDKVLVQAVFGSCPGIFAAVHEETVIGCIGAESDVIGHDGIGLLAGFYVDTLRRQAVHGVIHKRIRLRRELEVVGEAVIAGKDIDHVGPDDREDDREHD